MTFPGTNPLWVLTRISGAGNTITIAQFFGPLQQGTYAVASDKNSWVLHLPSGDVTFAK